MDEFIQVFIDHIPYDKEFIEELMLTYKNEFRYLGEYLKKHEEVLWAQDSPRMQELFDFLDGNGFEIVRSGTQLGFTPYTIKIIPIYPKILAEELKEINEKVKAAIEKMQSAFSEYVPVSYDTLSYTSVEADERPLLECEELFAPRPIRLRIYRCLEFLQLVSAGWGRSFTLPRPP